MRQRLSVHEAIEWVNAYASWKASRDVSTSEEECICAALRERLQRHPYAASYCTVHGDVRALDDPSQKAPTEAA
jgi:hypothetical protein